MPEGARPSTAVWTPRTSGPRADGRLRVNRLSRTPSALGESPVWDPAARCLWWIDGVAGQIRRLSWTASGPGEEDLFSFNEHIGALALATDGRLVVALEHSVELFEPGSGRTTEIVRLPAADPRMRLNDGKTDRQGRFLCAGMGRDGEAVGQLHSVDHGGGHWILASGLRTGNGVALSPDGRTLYFSDTPAWRIYACDYDTATGCCSEPRLHIDTESFGSGADGATVDASGDLWVALIRIGRIARFGPAGRLVDTLAAPTDLPSSLAFGGPDMETLFVTSIRDSGTGRAVSRHPDGGHLFAIEGLGVRGIPETRFGSAA